MAVADHYKTVQEIYIAYYQRPADPDGLAYWAGQLDAVGGNLDEIIDAFAGEQESKDLYGEIDAASIGDVIEAVYQAAFGRPADAAGKQFYIDAFNDGTFTAGQIALAVVQSPEGDDVAVIANKIAAADLFTNTVDGRDRGDADFGTAPFAATYAGAADADAARDFLSAVGEDAATVPSASEVTDYIKGEIADAGDAILAPGQSHTLTANADILTGNVFNAPMVFTPNGADRILSLQDEDVLTGTAGRTDNTLNVTMGNRNADEGTTATTTPYLYNIQNVNIDWTGNTNTLDLRNADSTARVDIKRVTADATTVTVDNIGTPAADLRVANTASDNVSVLFRYKQGVLTGNDTLTLELDDVLAAAVLQDARGAGGLIEGFETVNLHAINGVELGALDINEMETLVITGGGSLKIADLTPTAVVSGVEYLALDSTVGGIINPAAVGLLDLDASAFEGNLTLDVTNSLGGFADPRDSGRTVHGKVTGGSGDDAFWSSVGVSATSATNGDVIDGGDGNNRLILIDGDIDGRASISNIQTLELRNQVVATDVHNVDFKAFDDALTKVIMRDEDSDGSSATFNLNNVSAALAAEGLVLQHSVSEGVPVINNATVRVRLENASGSNDTVAIRVENERNIDTQFNYTLNFDGQANGVGAIENVTIVDADTESNNVTLSAAAEHSGTITLSGGREGDVYTVLSTLVAAEIDASEQASDLVLTVGRKDQTIKLGTGNDLLTFDGLDTFNGNDAITDEGGTDTVRAAFSRDVSGTPELAGIENLHIVATENASLDLARATDLTQLVLMSDRAVDENGEVFSTGIAAGQVATNDVITLKNTKLSEVNFWGDEDGTLVGGVPTTNQLTQIFNGLTLENNAGDSVKVNIAAPLQNLTNQAGNGIATYNLGQLTTHGVKDLSIEVANEVVGGATTNINNIWDRDLVNLSLKARGDVNVGTVTGNTVNSNIKTFDASAVGGNVTAVVKALGDSAKVTLANGDNNFDALGSAGNNVTIEAGNGDNQIRGTAQSDYIYTGSGNDVIHADRGNNTVKSGAGDDWVTALNGSNTVDLGSGKQDRVTFNYDTPAQMALATNVVAGSGTNAFIEFDSDNDGTVDTTYGFAVGDGAELSIKFTGTTFDPVASTLNGRSAIHADGVVVGSVPPTAAGVTGSPIYDANQSNLVVFTANPVLNESFAGGSAADVFLDLSTGLGNDYNVSAGAGNDAIIISQESTAAHIITGGTGADRVVLSAQAGKAGDTIVIAEGDSTLAGWDVITNFVSGTDALDLATIQTGTAANVTGFTAGFDFDGDGNVDTFTVAATGEITITDGDVGRGENYFGGVFGAQALLQYLASNATVVNDTFWFNYDSNGDGSIGAGDNAFVFQNLGTDLVVELVGTAAAAAAFDTTADIV